MKKQSMYIIVGVIIASVVLGWYFYDQGTFEETETEPNNVFDSGFGNWEINLYANLEDGRRVDLTSNANTGGDITYDGQVVTSLTYALEAEAVTPATYEPWDECEITMDSFRIDACIAPSSGGTMIDDPYSPLGTLQVIDVDAGLQEVFSWTYNFASAFDGADPGLYTISLIPEEDADMVLYRGITAAGGVTDYGDWKDPNLPPILTYDVDYTGEDVELTWNSTVTWN